MLGLVVSLLWLVCAREALAEIVVSKPEVIRTARIRILAWFSLVFITGWLFSLIIHLVLSSQTLGRP